MTREELNALRVNALINGEEFNEEEYRRALEEESKTTSKKASAKTSAKKKAPEKPDYSREELEAMRIDALASGTEYDEDFYDEEMKKIEAYEEYTNKKSKPHKAKVTVKEDKKKSSEIPELEEFSKVNRGISIPIILNAHDIHYKEQIWGINKREVNYKLEIVKTPKTAKDISDKFKGRSEEERVKAADGRVRYFKLVCYDNIPYRAREIAYVRLDRNKKISAVIDIKAVKEGNISQEILEKKLDVALKKLV